MIKKHLFLFALILWALIIAPLQCFAQTNNMDVLRLALTLSYELGNAVNDSSIEKVANSIVNYHKEMQKTDPNVTITDILFEGGFPTGPYGRTGPATANMSAKGITKQGEALGKATWQRCLKIAQKAVEGKLEDTTRGAYLYHRGNIQPGEILHERDTSPLYGAGQRVNIVYITYRDSSKLPVIHHNPTYNMDAAEGSDAVQETTSVSSSNAQLAPAAKKDNQVAKKVGNCSLQKMQEMYLQDDDVETYCWYCKIAVIVTNAFLVAASKVLPVSQSLGLLILRIGFLIWLAFYILQQVSSLAPIAPGKMLQTILVMGFKVALATVAIRSGLPVIREFFLNPIVGLGVDYGLALFDPLLQLAEQT